MLLWQNKDNELNIYDVTVNKNKLHAIKKKIIRKYGQIYDPVVVPYEEFQVNVIQPFRCDISHKVIKVESYEGDKVKYRTIIQPRLAILIEEIIREHKGSIPELYTHKNNGDIEGHEYIDEILSNINFKQVYNYTFESAVEMLQVLGDYCEGNKNSGILSMINQIMQTVLPEEAIINNEGEKKYVKRTNK